MARFGRQHRDRQRRDTRAQIDAITGSFYVRPEVGCEEARLVVDLEDPDFRLDQRLVTCDGKLVEFAVVLSRDQGGEWVEVYSVDTKHGLLHEHLSGHRRPNDRRDIKPLLTQVDVQESLDDPAMTMVLEKYRRMRS